MGLEKSRNLSKLFKDALEEIQAKSNNSFEFDLPYRIIGAAVHRLGEMRNQYGDISHGKTSLKEQVNDAELAEMVIGITDNICTYMLRKLDQIDVDDVVKYDEYEEFNQWLDDMFPLEGGVKYSRALYEQDIVDYEERLVHYNPDFNEEVIMALQPEKIWKTSLFGSWERWDLQRRA